MLGIPVVARGPSQETFADIDSNGSADQERAPSGIRSHTECFNILIYFSINYPVDDYFFEGLAILIGLTDSSLGFFNRSKTSTLVQIAL